jgi:hypothetical protein
MPEGSKLCSTACQPTHRDVLRGLQGRCVVGRCREQPPPLQVAEQELSLEISASRLMLATADCSREQLPFLERLTAWQHDLATAECCTLSLAC